MEQRYGLAGVMGWPVAHSRSPVLHTYWIEHYGLRGAYVLLPVQPQQLPAAIAGLKVLGFAGCNLTIPHKVASLQLVDAVDPVARRIGAINTIVVGADGSTRGVNTDGFGFLHSLLEEHPRWRADAGPAAVLGAGGAARAVIVSLQEQGAPEIRIVNRTLATARSIMYPLYSSTMNQICAHDDDWYKVLMFNGERAVIDLTFAQTTSAQDLDLHWFDSNGVDLTPCTEAAPATCTAAQGQSADANEHYEYTAPAGCAALCTYYVAVRGWAGAQNRYDITINFP